MTSSAMRQLRTTKQVGRRLFRSRGRTAKVRRGLLRAASDSQSRKETTMRALLHIGTEKTGSTSLQHWLEKNAEPLRAQGIWYSESLGRPNNRKLAVYGRQGHKPDDGFLQFRISNATEHAEWCLQLEADLSAEVARARAAGARWYVISSEHCHSRLLSPVSVSRLERLLHPHFEEITVLCFLRPQVEVFLSWMSSATLSGIPITNELLSIGPSDHYYNYLDLFHRWNRFGNSIQMVPLARNREVVATLSRILELDERDLAPAERKNESLDYRAIALANNVRLKRWLGSERNWNRECYLHRLSKGERLTLDREKAKELQSRFAESNACLARECPTVTLDDLTPDYERYPEHGTFAEVVKEAVFQPLLQEMVIRFNCELWLERTKTRIAEAEGCLLLGAIAMAERHARQAAVSLSHARQAELQDTAAQLQELEERVAWCLSATESPTR